MVACFLVGLTVAGLTDQCPPVKAFEYEMDAFSFVVAGCRHTNEYSSTGSTHTGGKLHTYDDNV